MDRAIKEIVNKEVRSDARSWKYSILSLPICAPFPGRVLEPCTTLTHMLYPGQYADQAKAVVKFRLKYIPVHDEIGDVDGFLNLSSLTLR